MTNAFAGLEPTSGGDYVKWELVGQSVTGTIQRLWVEVPPFDDSTEECPHLEILTTEGAKTLRGTQTNLRNKLIELGPQLAPGVGITITFSGLAGRAKNFDVTLSAPAAGAAPAAAPVAAPVAQAPAGQAPPSLT